MKSAFVDGENLARKLFVLKSVAVVYSIKKCEQNNLLWV